jgi:hypothetical protein
MEQWDEQALREINNLDAARLAIRGALATIRDLQDANGGLKGQVQDEQAKRRHLESRLSALDERILEWQTQSEAWAKERSDRDRQMEAWKSEARLEVRAEERARLEDDRRRTEELIAGLRADLTVMSRGHAEKEVAWNELRADLEKRDMEIAALRREKEEALDRARHELDMVEQLRLARDREIGAAMRSREIELADRENQIQSLKRSADETRRALEQLAKDQDVRVKAREEALAKAFSLKEKDLVDRYQKRETELQSQWSELEQGLWAKAKDSRAQLDDAVQKQFSERARQLADRAAEIEQLLERRKAEMDADFTKRCSEAEGRYAENERRLVDSWGDKEKRLVARVHAELDAERSALRDEWAARARALETEHGERLRQVEERRAELEREHKHKAARLLEDAARKDGERVRAQDEFVALKTAELEKLHAEKLAEIADARRALEEDARAREERRQADFMSRQALLTEESEKRRAELLEEHRRAVVSERAALAAEFDQRQHALDEDFRAKVAESERAGRALAEQFETWKSAQRAEFLRKEKDLDARWAAREGELTRKYDTALEEQRAMFAGEAAAARDAGDALRRRAEQEALRREQGLRAEFERGLAELRDAHARDIAARQMAHEARLVELRSHHDAALALTREKAFEDLARERTKLQEENARLVDKLHAEHTESERGSLSQQSRLKDLESRLSAAESDRRGLSKDLVTLQNELASMRLQLAERDRLRDADRARATEEARLSAASELAKSIEEAERQTSAALAARAAELERALAARRRALDESAAMRAAALDDRERRLEAEAARLNDERRGSGPV